MTRSTVDESVAEGRIEEFRATIKDALRLNAANPEFRRVATRLYVSLANKWGLTEHEAAALLDLTDEDYKSCTTSDGAELDTAQMEKISCLLGIYVSLGSLYSGHIDRSNAWLKRQNTGDLYSGNTPYSFLVGAPPSVFHLVRRDVAAWLV